MVTIYSIDTDNLGQRGDPAANSVDGGHTTPKRRGRLPRHRTSRALLEGHGGVDG